VAVGSIAGVLLGAGLAALFRFTYDQPLLLTGIRPFVLTAALIGTAEELLFRGFIQGKLSSLGWPAAVVLASLAHTAYKLSLFVFPKEGWATTFLVLGFFTFVVGCIQGALRQGTGSVIPPLTAHAFFDIFAYGDWTQAPWWVWG
jgi:membrane protease YdiL (CAAX protease family)